MLRFLSLARSFCQIITQIKGHFYFSTEPEQVYVAPECVEYGNNSFKVSFITQKDSVNICWHCICLIIDFTQLVTYSQLAGAPWRACDGKWLM